MAETVSPHDAEVSDIVPSPPLVDQGQRNHA
jgi:hypothetical protein